MHFHVPYIQRNKQEFPPAFAYIFYIFYIWILSTANYKLSWEYEIPFPWDVIFRRLSIVYGIWGQKRSMLIAMLENK